MQAAHCIRSGIERSGLPARISLFPIADGGSDTMQLLTKLTSASIIETQVSDPYGKTITCQYGWLSSEHTAIIGLSEASGIQFKAKNPDILLANTFGTGQQICDAIYRGAKTIIIGVGGSATTDGGAGMLQALGLKLLDRESKEIKDIPKRMLEVCRVKAGLLQQKISNVRFIVLCDVQNPLLGDDGAAKIFAPQKGANPKEIVQLEQCLQEWSGITFQNTGIDISQVKHGGAAGGAAAGLFGWAGAELISGINYVMDNFQLNDLLVHADYLLTGEGKIDGQTLKGKGPFEIAKRAEVFGVPVIAFAGQSEETDGSIFTQVITINKSSNLQIEIEKTCQNLEAAAFQWLHQLAIQ